MGLSLEIVRKLQLGFTPEIDLANDQPLDGYDQKRVETEAKRYGVNLVTVGGNAKEA
ncbi:MAG: hypothetical protein KCHDKBKB_00687 [Elusimicrobia bacterium]|nr:hypothetical protein [Elusimicrobiota bacterium]